MKKHKFVKSIYCLVLCIFLLSQNLYANAESGDYIVYVTNTGEKYHKYSCSYLKSVNAITLAEAIDKGYTPCSRCKPPSLTRESQTTATPITTPRLTDTPKVTSTPFVAIDGSPRIVNDVVSLATSAPISQHTEVSATNTTTRNSPTSNNYDITMNDNNDSSINSAIYFFAIVALIIIVFMFMTISSLDKSYKKLSKEYDLLINECKQLSYENEKLKQELKIQGTKYQL